MVSPASSNQMGLLACISYVIGVIIGSGIFITPVFVLDYTRSASVSLLIWLISGLISLLGGISYIELATAIPSDGGDYSYQSFVGWKALAFCFMLVTCLFTFPGSTSVQAVAFGEYLVQGLEPYVHIDPSYKDTLEHAIGIMLIVFCSVLNFLSLEKFASRFQIVVTVAKTAVLATIIGIGAYSYLFTVGGERFNEPVKQRDTNAGNLAMALYNGLWAYAGWDVLSYGIPSVKNPRRTLPIALIGSLLAITVTYIMVNVSFFVVLGPQKVLESKAVAADFAQASSPLFGALVPFATAVMLLGTVNAEIFCSSRTIFQAAHQGDLPAFLSVVHAKTGSYRAALLLQMSICIGMTFIDVETVINYVSFVMWSQKLTTMVALFYIKTKKLEVDPGALRIPSLIGVVFLISLVIPLAIIIFTQFLVTLIGMAIVASGLVLYCAFIYPKKLPTVLVKLNNWLSSITCRLLSSEIHQAIHQDVKEPVDVELPVLNGEDDLHRRRSPSDLLE